MMGNSNTTIQTMVSLLSNYQQLVVKQLNKHEMVGEYLTDDVDVNVRLLCQMRTIIFLLKTAHLFKDVKHVDLAEALYAISEEHFFKDGVWLQQKDMDQEANLYSYAFVILAQSYLYKITKNPLYAMALAETYNLIEPRFTVSYLFKPLSAHACLEQNSAMHLFEALTFAYYQAEAIYMKGAIKQLEELLASNFWQKDKNVLAEKVTLQNAVVSYEAGHWFEWVSLLWRVEQAKGKAFINKDILYSSAIKYATLTDTELVLNEMDSVFQPLDLEQIRIWPSLEYLRAKTLMEHRLPIVALDHFMAAFFDNKGLPKEYLSDQPVEKVKSTTGYHIAESFVDMLSIGCVDY